MSAIVLKIMKGANWLLFVSWYTRLAGMMAFFVLARYLSKDDFGIIIGCFFVRGFFEILANFGTGHYLIKKKEVTKSDLDIAWTINFTSRTIIAAFTFILSDSIANFMHIPELGTALKLMALSPLFIGLHNPALSLKVKNLDYAAISYLQTITKTISTTVTLVIAITFQSFFAVVFAEIIYQLIYAIGSYVVISYRPRFAFAGIYKQWSFSKWILLKSIVIYLKYKCDDLIASRSFSLTELGMYNFSKESSATVVNFLINPVSSIFYAGLSEYAEDKEQLVDKIYKFIIAVAFIYTPVVFGGVYLSELIVPIVFGEKWASSTGMFSIFLIMTYAGCFNRMFSDVFILINEVKKHFIYELISSICVVLVVIGMSALPLEHFAQARVVIAYFVLISVIFFLATLLQIKIVSLLKLIILPVVVSILMLLSLALIDFYIEGYSKLTQLLVSIFISMLFYPIVSMLSLKWMKDKYYYYDYLYNEIIIKLYQKVVSKCKSTLYRFSHN